MSFPKKNSTEASTTRTSSSAQASATAAPQAIEDIGKVVARINTLLALVSIPLPPIALNSDLDKTLDAIVDRLEGLGKQIPGLKVTMLELWGKRA